MTQPGVRSTAVSATGQSIGDLVSLAARDVSQLVRCELDLAKIELRSDARRLGMGSALLGVAGFVACLVLVLLCFALAYGFIALGIWAWAAFLIVAGTCLVLAGLAVLIGLITVRRLSALRQTRTTVSADMALLRRHDGAGTTTGSA